VGPGECIDDGLVSSVLIRMSAPPHIARANGRKGGRPRGAKSRLTIEKEAMRDAVRTRVFQELIPLIDAQIAQALGIKYLVVRDSARESSSA
jgi:hypothetical protein